MKILFYTSAVGLHEMERRYLFECISRDFTDVTTVAVAPPRLSIVGRFRKAIDTFERKRRLGGWRYVLELVSGYPLQRMLRRRDQARIHHAFRELVDGSVEWPPRDIKWVQTVNGDDAVSTIAAARPDVVIQAGAGILRPPVLEIPRITTINIHAGIAPAVRGMDSIYWALLRCRPDWVGATVHEVDAGIDSGNPLVHVRSSSTGDFPTLFVEVVSEACRVVPKVLRRLEAGERWSAQTRAGDSRYFSTISGWKLLRLQLRFRPR